ncbi:LLM class flavin-dependent oxidoreductase [Peribacillus sp. SCS-26]|uniref:LLM class flavin-dependent oxidoreductase n=1 Tax=Paraperibacillus marinus TaxID=3115295 RepID=UPI003906AB23
MKLSILDQAPILEGSDANTALNEAARLAAAGEVLGYSRYWIAEHHDIGGLACPAPEVMLSYIGTKTKSIRIGSGAVLLPHYKPYKIAESFNLLAVLFPGRIDLGIGRAPGGSAEASMALSDNFLEQVRMMPDKYRELLHFLDRDFPGSSMFSKIKASPVPDITPEPWLLGTSKKSALLAAETGSPYVFGQFMSDADTNEVIRLYREHYQPRKSNDKPKVIAAVSVICASDRQRADEIRHEMQRVRKMHEPTGSADEEREAQDSKTITGNPMEVKEKLLSFAVEHSLEELMIITMAPTYSERIESYRLIAEEML